MRGMLWPVIVVCLVGVVRGQEVDLSAVGRRIVEGTNGFRKGEGREGVAVNEKLGAVATKFAKFMADSGKYGHEADGRSPAGRAKAGGYGYCIVLENIAMMYDSRGLSEDQLVEGFVKGWEKSPGHRKNMLDGDVTETGVGVARAGDGKYYAVQMFGRPESAKVEFAVENRSGAEVTYKVGGLGFTLPVRATRTHTECRAVEVVFGEGKKYAVKSGERFVVGDGGAVRVVAGGSGARSQ